MFDLTIKYHLCMGTSAWIVGVPVGKRSAQNGGVSRGCCGEY